MRAESNAPQSTSIHDSVGFWTSLLAKVMEEDFNRRLSGYGMTRVDYAVLGAIHFDQQTTPSSLAGFLGLDRAAITRLLDKLEAQGLIERNRTKADRRSVLLSVTAKGKALAVELAQKSQGVNAHFTTGLKSQDIQRYVETVKKMLANGKTEVDSL